MNIHIHDVLMTAPPKSTGELSDPTYLKGTMKSMRDYMTQDLFSVNPSANNNLLLIYLIWYQNHNSVVTDPEYHQFCGILDTCRSRLALAMCNTANRDERLLNNIVTASKVFP